MKMLGLRDELMTLYLKLDAYPDVAEALKAMRAKSKRTAILSNGSPSMLDSAVRAAGLEKSIRYGFVGGGCGNLQAKPAGLPPRHAETANPGRALHLLCLGQ